MRVQHFDRIGVRFDRSTVRTNPDGSRFVDGFGAHVGPYTYHDDKGQPFIEHVPASTLFSQASLDSAAGSTLTIRHGPGLVTPDRYRLEAHGSWVKAWDAGDGQLGVRLRLGSEDALTFIDEAIAKGDPVELSPVYEVDVVEGVNADGERELVQEGRMYSGIAMLGPQEARGGPGTRLQLDGPECAPKGSRIQVSRGRRLDRAPRVPLHSNPTGRSTMKHAHISHGGRRRKISADTLASIRGLTSKKDAANADQIAVGRVLVEIEGEEPVDLMLPVAMIEMLLEGIGAGPASAPPPTEEPAAEEVALEATDAGDEDEKLDAKIAASVKRMFDSRDRKLNADAARRTSVNADAATILPPGYDYGVHWTQVALDAIAKVAPESEARAKAYAAKIRAPKGDAMLKGVAEGMLRQMLTQHRTLAAGAGVQLASPKTDSETPSAPWASDTIPEVEQ